MTEEEKRLEEAVDEFAAEMKARLFKKADLGYAGWDNPLKADDIRQDMQDDALATHPEHLGDEPRLFVDIANRAMMLWRHVRPKGKEVQS